MCLFRLIVHAISFSEILFDCIFSFRSQFSGKSFQKLSSVSDARRIVTKLKTNITKIKVHVLNECLILFLTKIVTYIEATYTLDF